MEVVLLDSQYLVLGVVGLVDLQLVSVLQVRVLQERTGLAQDRHPVQRVLRAQALSQPLVRLQLIQCVHQPLHLALLVQHGLTRVLHLAQHVQRAQVQTALLHLLALQPQILFVDLLQVQLLAPLDNMSPDLHALGVLLERIKIHHPLQALLAHLALLVHLA
jgi:hypothetical protein